MKYTKEDYISALQEVSEKVDGELSIRKYQKLKDDNHPDESQFYRRFGGFNSVKEIAGLKKNKSGGKLNADYCFFEKLDTDEKLYWLGFLMGDGSVYRNQAKNKEMGLGITDKEHVHKLKKALNAEHKISEDSSKAYLRITDDKLTSDLSKHGVGINKTFNSELPNIKNEKKWSSFVRGLFDADGSVYFGPTSVKWYISGSKGRMEKLVDILPIDADLINGETNKDHTWLIKTNSISDIKILTSWMYPDFEHPRLDRKFEKMVEIEYGVR